MGDADPELLQLLPHRPPFLFLTRILSMSSGTARAAWELTGHEDFFRGHFPGQPIVPGVLIGEALAQTAGLAIPDDDSPHRGRGRSGSLARIDLKFSAPAHPPVTLELEARIAGSLGDLHQFDVVASVEGRPIARGQLAIAVTA
jgi:3-hydroxyacyl-[acyl-carrier-protein] dehydratase